MSDRQKPPKEVTFNEIFLKGAGIALGIALTSAAIESLSPEGRFILYAIIGSIGTGGIIYAINRFKKSPTGRQAQKEAREWDVDNSKQKIRLKRFRNEGNKNTYGKQFNEVFLFIHEAEKTKKRVAEIISRLERLAYEDSVVHRKSRDESRMETLTLNGKLALERLSESLSLNEELNNLRRLIPNYKSRAFDALLNNPNITSYPVDLWERINRL